MLSSSSSSSSSSSVALHDSLCPPISRINRKSNKRCIKTSDSPKPAFVSLPLSPRALTMAIPMAASISILLWTTPGNTASISELHAFLPGFLSFQHCLPHGTPLNAGLLSGFSGLESVPAPQLPEIDFLKKWNNENQKKYAEFDSRFRSSDVLKELLERSKLNKERNKREIQDKYCLRGAEWGVGDCSTQGMTAEERDTFIQTLKKKIKE